MFTGELMPLRLVAVGDPLQVSAWGFLCAKVLTTSETQEKETLKELLADKTIGVLLISQDMATRCQDILSKQVLTGPVILVLPTGFDSEDPAGAALRKLVTEAVGVDLLGKERIYGKDS